MKNSSVAINAASIVVGAACIFGCNPSKPSPSTDPVAATSASAATVNGETISLEDFNEHMGVKQTATVMSPRGPSETRVLGNFGLQALQELIDQRVLLQMAKESSALPTEADIDAELKLQSSLQPGYTTMLHSQGLDDKVIRDELKIGLARQHMISQGVTVTQEEVDKYIKSHPERFTAPAKAALLYLQVKSAATKAQVDAELAAGKKFEDVAKEINPAIKAQPNGLMYPLTVVSEMSKPVQLALSGTAEKACTSWVVNGAISTKFYVVSKTPATLTTPTAETRELVKRALAMQKGQLKNNFDSKFYERLRAATVDVQVPYLKETWSKAWNQITAPGMKH